MDSKVVQKKKSCAGRTCLVWGMGSMAIVGTAILVVFWCTNLFRDAILSALELKNGTTTYGLWERPLVRAAYRIRIFNYTNVDEFESGLDPKLKVQELGPYIYRETLTRVNVQSHENGTITYQEKRAFQWEGGRPDDEMIRVPNVPLFTAMAFSRDLNFMAQVTLTAILTTLQAKTFVTVPAGGFLWGYDDKIFQMAKPVMALRQPITFDKFGMLASKVGVSKDRINIRTGSGDLGSLGLVQRLNGDERLHVWDDEQCDTIFGTDGTMFPPHLIRDPNATLHVFCRDMCRTIPLHYEGRTMVQGIPTLRYKPPTDLFNASRSKDFCYCSKVSEGAIFSDRSCPKAGIFNVSSCHFGTPVLTSFPHFYLGDKSLLEQIEGLNPQQELHETYVDLHPLLAVPIGGWSRLQLNLEARKAVGVPFMGKLKDGEVLPLFWVEVGIDNIPDSVISILHHAYFTASAVEIGFQWGSLFLVLVSTCLLLFTMKKTRTEHRRKLKRNISGENRLLE
ncbi:lysosome membrane protein 2-like [Orussus abietinus]|uniref:lysosome membrane protein 2-like n=1 Tax=Orussus abietinus TaxID=222816 RepID=UPI0006255BDE|nr:lysosome membrane protein 2-like [Orussus abietinus]